MAPPRLEPEPLAAQTIINYVYYCAGCHGANGEGSVDAHAPSLAGRSAALLARQLRALLADQPDGPRPNRAAGAHASLPRLDSAQIEAMANYLASLAPAPPAAVR